MQLTNRVRVEKRHDGPQHSCKHQVMQFFPCCHCDHEEHSSSSETTDSHRDYDGNIDIEVEVGVHPGEFSSRAIYYAGVSCPVRVHGELTASLQGAVPLVILVGPCGKKRGIQNYADLKCDLIYFKACEILIGQIYVHAHYKRYHVP